MNTLAEQSTAPLTVETPSERLSCLEVWGGGSPADTLFNQPGLDVAVWSSDSAINKAKGTLHFVSSCASGRITRVFMAEVYGHSASSETLACRMRDLMKNNVNVVRQARLVQGLSHGIQEAADSGAFASALSARYFAPTRSFALSNGGHPSPLYYCNQRRTWSIVRGSSASGIDASSRRGTLKSSEYRYWKTTLHPGDRVLCFGNSLTECLRPDGRTLGISGLLDLLNNVAEPSNELLPRSLAEKVLDAHPDNREVEDATIVLCTGADTHGSLKDALLAPLRLLRPVSDRTRL